MKQKRFLSILIITVLAMSTVDALDFAVRLMPEATFPLTQNTGDQKSLYNLSYGGSLNVDVEMFNLLAPFAEFAYRQAPYADGESTSALHLVSGGGGVSAFVYPISRLRLGLGAGGGIYMGMITDKSMVNVYWNARAEAGFRVNAGFSVSAACEYVQYLQSTGLPLFDGLSVGLTANVNSNLFSQSSAALTIQGTQSEDIFPIINNQYLQSSFGSVNIRNTESSEIEDVVVSFQVKGYTSQPTVCRRVPAIPKGGTVEAPLLATFGEQVLSLTEKTKVQGELTVTYKLLGTPRTATQSFTIGMNGRNNLTWKDAKILAAFSSPNDPAVLEDSKLVAGLIRDKIRTGIDSNLQYGMGLFEGIRLSGVSYSQDPDTPYVKLHADKNARDYVQFPYQTFTYKSGDCDDLAVLYASLLESVGVKASILPMADDVCVAFPLTMSDADARTSFLDPASFIYRDGLAWVPVQMSLLRQGFLSAWQSGAKKYNEAAAAGSAPEQFTMEDGWKAFKPISLPSVEFTLPRPTEEQVKLAFENALTRFINREIGPKVQKMLSDMGPSGGSVRQQNSLGVLYARYGLIAEAKVQFEKAAAKDSVPALSNLGNIAFLEKNYEDAVAYFQKVLALQPDNKAALLGLARAMYELDDFAQSDVLFAKVQKIDAPLANQYAYLSSKIEGATSRASAATERNRMNWNEESE